MKEHPEYAYLGLNVVDAPDTARAFLAENGWSWPQIQDPNRELSKRLGADYQPFVALLDERGEVVATLDGAGDDASWSAMLEKL